MPSTSKLMQQNTAAHLCIFALSLLVVLSGGLSICTRPCAPPPPPIVAEETAEVADEEAEEEPELDTHGIELNFATYRKETRSWYYEAKYPVLGSDKERDRFSGTNRRIKQFVLRRARQIQGRLEPEPYPFECTSKGKKQAIYVECKVRILTPELISMQFDETFDLGGAHPGHSLRTLTCQIASRVRLLELEDLFVKPVPHELIGELCVANAHEEYKSELLAEIDETSFKEFLITPDCLEICFVEDEPGTGLFDAPRISIPYDELAPVLSPSTPVKALATQSIAAASTE